MEKADYLFLLIAALISLIIGICLTMYVDINQRDIPYYISLIGTLITVTGLAFTIYQQIQIKSKSKLIEENTRNYQESLRSNFYGWSLNRAISLTEKLESLLNSDKNLPTCLFILKELQSILADCKRANLIHYNRKLEECLNCLSNKPTKEEINNAINKCKNECELDWVNKFKQYNEQLSAENVLMTRKIHNSKNQFDKEAFLKKVIQIRTYLQDIKPDFLSLTKP